MNLEPTDVDLDSIPDNENAPLRVFAPKTALKPSKPRQVSKGGKVHTEPTDVEDLEKIYAREAAEEKQRKLHLVPPPPAPIGDVDDARASLAAAIAAHAKIVSSRDDLDAKADKLDQEIARLTDTRANHLADSAEGIVGASANAECLQTQIAALTADHLGHAIAIKRLNERIAAAQAAVSAAGGTLENATSALARRGLIGLRKQTRAAYEAYCRLQFQVLRVMAAETGNWDHGRPSLQHSNDGEGLSMIAQRCGLIQGTYRAHEDAVVSRATIEELKALAET